MPDSNQQAKCLCGTCARPAARRGLCLVCYSRAKKMVENGEYTWARLEELGLVLSDATDDPFLRALGEATRRDDAPKS